MWSNIHAVSEIEMVEVMRREAAVEAGRRDCCTRSSDVRASNTSYEDDSSRGRQLYNEHRHSEQRNHASDIGRQPR